LVKKKLAGKPPRQSGHPSPCEFFKNVRILANSKKAS
jgi:hypothetical protein